MAQILDGKFVSKKILDNLRAELGIIKNTHPHLPLPCLCIFLVGHHAPSRAYVQSKIKRCEEIGFQPLLIHVEETISEDIFIEQIKNKIADPNVHGVMVQLPLPKHIREHSILDALNPLKDVDGMHYMNLGKVCYNDPQALIPATPYGILLLLSHYHIATSGQHCVVVGRSQIVGRPLSIVMSSQHPQGNCTVTLCHSHTRNLKDICRSADILVAAIGKPLFIQADMVKQGAIVIDVGINQVQDNTSTKGVALVGDVDFNNVEPLCSYITPVPGGVGPMTIAGLMVNTLKAYKIQMGL